ncbi:hypothetical protein ACHAXA_003067 [Cyclostephanos tholiformis]|uniref:Uncharacterized protein n=1 Tax=Cyclostephanos tholiformis TaxID=382380 RepID=A0ABD3RAX2_9STRA
MTSPRFLSTSYRGLTATRLPALSYPLVNSAYKMRGMRLISFREKGYSTPSAIVATTGDTRRRRRRGRRIRRVSRDPHPRVVIGILPVDLEIESVGAFKVQFETS